MKRKRKHYIGSDNWVKKGKRKRTRLAIINAEKSAVTKIKSLSDLVHYTFSKPRVHKAKYKIMKRRKNAPVFTPFDFTWKQEAVPIVF